MAPMMIGTYCCKVYCPVCQSGDITPERIMVWMAGSHARGIRDVVNFMRYGGGA